MRAAAYYIFSLALLSSSCQTEDISAPTWIDRADTLFFPIETLSFTSEIGNWEASIITTIQPVELEVEYSSAGFTAIASKRSTFTQGCAMIQLSKDKNAYFFPVFLADTLKAAYRRVDHRSPKMINPDIGLEQQSIRWKTDENRSLVQGEDQSFFQEDRRYLSPKTAIKRAIADNPLTSYYVRPGSVISIPLSVHPDNLSNEWNAKAGPLYDSYNNTLADGTEVSFKWERNEISYVQTAMTSNGLADILIPIGSTKRICIHAEIYNTRSETKCSKFK